MAENKTAETAATHVPSKYVSIQYDRMIAWCHDVTVDRLGSLMPVVHEACKVAKLKPGKAAKLPKDEKGNLIAYGNFSERGVYRWAECIAEVSSRKSLTDSDRAWLKQNQGLLQALYGLLIQRGVEVPKD